MKFCLSVYLFTLFAYKLLDIFSMWFMRWFEEHKGERGKEDVF